MHGLTKKSSNKEVSCVYLLKPLPLDPFWKHTQLFVAPEREGLPPDLGEEISSAGDLIFLEYNAYCHMCTWETFLPGLGSFSTWDFPVHYQWENLNRKHKTERFKAPKAKEKTTNIYQAKRLFKTFDDLSPKSLVMPWRQPQSLEWMALPFPCCSFAQCPWWVWTVVHLNCSSAPHLTHIQQQQWEATRRYIF